MKAYFVKVTEKCSDVFLIYAEDKEEAIKNALEQVDCKSTYAYDSEIIREEEIEDCDKR